ncbi:MAG: divalent-cation tolerance protein CutA, partial [Spirochaetales bacterium]|nr:divalent-cation tolerance protein CutA [Spirochaetales bacterium]
MNEDFGLVIISAPKTHAEPLSLALVEKGAAACVQAISGVVSTYRWKGKIERDEEVLLLAKTRRSKLEEISLLLKALHPYEVPELVFLPITGGSQPYLDWLGASVS